MVNVLQDLQDIEQMLNQKPIDDSLLKKKLTQATQRFNKKNDVMNKIAIKYCDYVRPHIGDSISNTKEWKNYKKLLTGFKADDWGYIADCDASDGYDGGRKRKRRRKSTKKKRRRRKSRRRKSRRRKSRKSRKSRK